MATFDSYGNPIIVYNPFTFEMMGPALQAFFFAHEYAHHQLGHVNRAMFVQNDLNQTWIRRDLEIEADKWAARRLAIEYPGVVRAAIHHFEYTQGMGRGSELHPTGLERAAAIRNAAGM